MMENSTMRSDMESEGLVVYRFEFTISGFYLVLLPANRSLAFRSLLPGV
jgi:hypothetical protein